MVWYFLALFHSFQKLNREQGIGEVLRKRLMVKIKAIVLDLDGTLVHTTVDFSRMKLRLIDWLIKQGVPTHLVSTNMTVIDNLKATRQFLLSIGRKEDVAMIDSAANQLMSNTEMDRVEETVAIPGAAEVLKELRSEGYLVCLLTRGSRRYAIAALKAAGIGFKFDATICRDDFPEAEAKPNGKALLRIAEAVGVEPEECILVGDHFIDLECAQSSSARFVGVLTGSFTKERWAGVGNPDLIESIALLPGYLRDLEER